jgi:hypothetical protein
MFDQYIKLFNISWIEPWIVEAMVIVFGGMLLMFMICKAMDCINGEDQQ